MPVRLAKARPDASSFRGGASVKATPRSSSKTAVVIPGEGDVTIDVNGKAVPLTNLSKIFWPDDGITKGDLIQYYADVSPYLLPHIQSRAMVLKRYPNGAFGEFFFQKR